MKKWIGLTIVLFVAVFGLMACGEGGRTDGQAERPVEDQAQPYAREDTQPTEPQAGQPMEQAAEPGRTAGYEEEIRGTLIETEDGVTIYSDMGNFLIEGHDVAELVGRDVLVTGTIEEREGTQVIDVTSISVIE